LLDESFVNLIGDDPRKQQYADQVWDVLQRSYAPIGGIAGSGFNSKQDMIDNIPMWKMDVHNGKVYAVIMYKDKGGRKVVAGGTDGSARGKRKYVDIVKNELKRAYGEKSKAALGATIKLYGDDIEQFMMTPQQASSAIKKDVVPLTQYKGKLDPADKLTATRFAKYRRYMYLREIGGKMHLKIMMGTPGRGIR